MFVKVATYLWIFCSTQWSLRHQKTATHDDGWPVRRVPSPELWSNTCGLDRIGGIFHCTHVVANPWWENGRLPTTPSAVRNLFLHENAFNHRHSMYRNHEIDWLVENKSLKQNTTKMQIRINKIHLPWTSSVPNSELSAKRLPVISTTSRIFHAVLQLSFPEVASAPFWNGTKQNNRSKRSDGSNIKLLTHQ